MIAFQIIRSRLAHVAQYQLLGVYLAAIVIVTDSMSIFGLSDLGLGFLLLGLNLIIVALALRWCYQRHVRDKQQQHWRNVLSDREAGIINQVMLQSPPPIRSNGDASASPPATDAADAANNSSTNNNDDDGGGGGNYYNEHSSEMAAAAAAAAAAVGSKEEAEAYRKRSDNILKEYLISPELVVLENKVGSGSFGDVYKGKCLGDHPAAIKTMKEVTEASALAFRREILLTASLRAPNVVHFVGACWGKELTCLILEWMPHGSLQTMLDLDGEQPPPAAAEALSRALGEDVAGAAAASAAASAARKAERLLHWGEPLLRLATDIARGMAYLHNRRLVPYCRGLKI